MSGWRRVWGAGLECCRADCARAARRGTMPSLVDALEVRFNVIEPKLTLDVLHDGGAVLLSR